VVGKVAISVLLTATFVVALLPVSARPCILSNVASEKACQPKCCANQTCCETSAKNTSAPSQPLAKTDAGQRLNALSFTAVTTPLPSYEPAAKRIQFDSVAVIAASSPQLAVRCTFLI
jgi:hypothetical protein